MESLKRIGRDLHTELARIVAIINDRERLNAELIGETWGITATMSDFIDDFYRIECDANQRIERSRYVAIVEDVRNSVVKLRFALRDGKTTTIKVECAIIRCCLAQLTDLLEGCYAPEILEIPELEESIL